MSRSKPGYNPLMVDADVIETVTTLAARAPGLELLVLHGSQARGDAREGSDWDLAYLAVDGFDPDAFRAELVFALRDDRVDLADLAPAGGLLRYRVARDGKVLYEAREGVFESFWVQAVTFWCDAEPVLSRGYEAVLAGYA